MPAHRRSAAVLVALAVAVVLGGCSGSLDAASGGGGSSSGSVAEGRAADSGDAGSSSQPAPAAAAAAAAALQSTAVQPRVVRTAEITVRVGNLRTAAARVRAAAEALGGRVASETTGFGQGAEPAAAGTEGSSEAAAPSRGAAAGESVLVLRVPEPQLAAALERVAGVGTELSRASSAQDVTADLADLGSRVQTQQASVARVRRLMQRAASLPDVVLLEGELARRESELEALQARRTALADRADLATVTAVLRTPDAEPQDAGTGFLAGLRDSWHALQASTAVLLTAIGAVIPVAVLVLLLGWPALLLWRRRRARRPAPPAPAVQP
jgi:hypothetical protein